MMMMIKQTICIKNSAGGMAQYILLFLHVIQQEIRFPHFRRVNVCRSYAAKVTSIPLKPIVYPILYIAHTVKLIGVDVHTS